MSYYTDTRKAPYAFHHVQNLTTRSADFIASVKAQDTRGNVDSPESGMDALMQAIVCKGMIDHLVAYFLEARVNETHVIISNRPPTLNDRKYCSCILFISLVTSYFDL